jgi:hypothetical protein
LKNNTVHGVNKPWIEKTSTEDLKNSEFGKIVHFSYKDYAHGAKASYMTMKVHTFIGRLICHIPDKYFQMIRYAGLFSNRWKKQYLTQARTVLILPESDDCSENTKPLWAERQSEYTGLNPLQCPNCNKPLTSVGRFFGNWNQLQLFQHSKIPCRRHKTSVV